MRRWPGFKCRGLKIFERDLIARAASSLAMPNLAKTFLRVSPDAIVCCASIGGVSSVLGSFSSSFASDEKKLNFWRRLTAVQLDSTEIEDNYEMNFVRALEEIEKLTGANDMVSLHKRYERFRALNAK